VSDLLRHVLELPDFPKDTLLNVNLPPIPPAEVRGVKLTRLGRRVYSNSLTPMRDPWGRDIYWIGGGSATWRGEADSDFQAVRDGYVSVTPLSLDLTHHTLLTDTASWWRTP
jgi:5'-nucleotidase